MLAALIATSAALTGPPALPQLPAEGIAVSRPAGITLYDARGTVLARLAGYHFVPEYVLNSGLPRLRDAAGRKWNLDVRAHRLVRAERGLPLAAGATIAFQRRTWIVRRGAHVLMRMLPRREFPFLDEDREVVSTARRALDLTTGKRLALPRSCVLASRRALRSILLCGGRLPRSIEELVAGKRHRLVGPAHVYQGRVAGHWIYVRAAPRGRTLLAQWSGECESPAAFLLTSGKLRELGGKANEAGALGWTADGRALVHFPRGVCGGTAFSRAGIYVLGDTPRLIIATGRGDVAALWD